MHNEVYLFDSEDTALEYNRLTRKPGYRFEHGDEVEVAENIQIESSDGEKSAISY